MPGAEAMGSGSPSYRLCLSFVSMAARERERGHRRKGEDMCCDR